MIGTCIAPQQKRTQVSRHARRPSAAVRAGAVAFGVRHGPGPLAGRFRGAGGRHLQPVQVQHTTRRLSSSPASLPPPCPPTPLAILGMGGPHRHRATLLHCTTQGLLLEETFGAAIRCLHAGGIRAATRRAAAAPHAVACGCRRAAPSHGAPPRLVAALAASASPAVAAVTSAAIASAAIANAVLAASLTAVLQPGELFAPTARAALGRRQRALLAAQRYRHASLRRAASDARQGDASSADDQHECRDTFCCGRADAAEASGAAR